MATSGAARLDECPDFLTVEEVRAILRISRGNAYELIRRWTETGGRDGLEHRRFGRVIRIPKTVVERLTAPSDPVPAPLDLREAPTARRRRVGRQRLGRAG